MGRTEPASTVSKEVGLPVVPRKFIGIVIIGTFLNWGCNGIDTKIK